MWVAFASLVVVSCMFNATAHAADLVVQPGQSIQAAIQSASTGDRVLVQPGTYAEAIDTLGKWIEIIGVGGAAVTTIDATGLTTSTVTLSGTHSKPSIRGFTITGGTGSAHPDGTFGGGGIIDRDGGSARIEACIVQGNGVAHAGDGAGGGVLGRMQGFIVSDAPDIVDCVLRDNAADDAGGGAAGFVSLRRCVIEGNTAARGGGVFVQNTGIFRTAIRSNTAQRGGGMYMQYGWVDFVRVEENAATLEGGGIFGDHPKQPWMTLKGVRVVDNVAPVCGGMSLRNDAPASPSFATINLWYCVFAANTSSTGGDDVRIVGPTAELWVHRGSVVDDTILSTCGGPTTIYNSIVRGGTWSHTGAGSVQILGSNIEGGAPGLGNFDADPLFTDPTRFDFHLASHSPCIDAGLTQSDGQVDIESNAIDVAPDVGADEFAPALSLDGNPTPGGAITAEIHGAAAGPVLLLASFGALDASVTTPAGEFHLGLPLIAGTPFVLGFVPANGHLEFTERIPRQIQPGTPFFAQALWSDGTLSPFAWTLVR